MIGMIFLMGVCSSELSFTSNGLRVAVWVMPSS